ncbi:MAG: hypothetical protein FVQ84_04490 [Planctomycetes bacterium]|nr:hypothetical protein [Planctomycetota bacterium]
MHYKYLENLNVFSVLICFFCISLSVEAKGTQNIRLQIEDLIQMAAASREEITSIDITYEINQTMPESLREKGIINAPSDIKRRLLVDLNSIFFYEERSIKRYNSREKETKAIETYDGQNRMIFLPEKEIGGIEEQEIDKKNLKKALMVKIPPLIAALMYPPKNDGIGVDDGSMVSLLKHGTLRKKTETVDGRETYVVDAEFNGIRYATVWLDIERGVMPLRSVMYGATGDIRFDQKITDIKEFDNEKGNRFWLPVSFEYTKLIKGEKMTISKKIESDKTRINLPTERSMFRITFPPNTTIHDSVIDLTYQIPGNEFESENYLTGSSNEEIDNSAPKLTAYKDKSMAQSDQKPEILASNSTADKLQNKSSYTLLGCIAVILLIIVAFFMYTKFSTKVE